jgi:vacuolar-type H+-ATPase subunit I/STV1
MKEITLTVDNDYVGTLVAFLKTLGYVRVSRVEEAVAKPLTEAEKREKRKILFGEGKTDLNRFFLIFCSKAVHEAKKNPFKSFDLLYPFYHSIIAK